MHVTSTTMLLFHVISFEIDALIVLVHKCVNSSPTLNDMISSDWNYPGTWSSVWNCFSDKSPMKGVWTNDYLKMSNQDYTEDVVKHSSHINFCVFQLIALESNGILFYNTHYQLLGDNFIDHQVVKIEFYSHIAKLVPSIILNQSFNIGNTVFCCWSI